jgi:hypothetical protein
MIEMIANKIATPQSEPMTMPTMTPVDRPFEAGAAAVGSADGPVAVGDDGPVAVGDDGEIGVCAEGVVAVGIVEGLSALGTLGVTGAADSAVGARGVARGDGVGVDGGSGSMRSNIG